MWNVRIFHQVSYSVAGGKGFSMVQTTGWCSSLQCCNLWGVLMRKAGQVIYPIFFPKQVWSLCATCCHLQELGKTTVGFRSHGLVWAHVKGKRMVGKGYMKNQDYIPQTLREQSESLAELPYQSVHKFRVKQIFLDTSVCHFSLPSLSVVDWPCCIPPAFQRARNKSHGNGLNAWGLSSCLN